MHTTRWSGTFLRKMYRFFFTYVTLSDREYTYASCKRRVYISGIMGTENRTEEIVCIKMQRSTAYCVCSLTFHARCWLGDVLSRAPLWCQDRRSLHRRSNNGCSKTQQVSLKINFQRSERIFN